jgi:hypothetical protein
MPVLARRSFRQGILGGFPQPSPVANLSSTRGPCLSIGLPTLIGLAPMLGHRLDDRCSVAEQQDAAIARRLIRASETPLPGIARPQDFYVAPLDILPYRRDGQRRFQLLELNGTGIGGLTNMPIEIVEAILETVGEIGAHAVGAAPVVVVASSGSELPEERRPNHLLHEKALFVDCIARSLRARHGDVEILALETLAGVGGWRARRPAVVLGYSRDLIKHSVIRSGIPRLFGRDIAAIVNDRFLLNLEAAQGQLNNDAFLAANRCYEAGADKAAAYRLANSFKAGIRFSAIPQPIRFTVADTEDALVTEVRARLAAGELLVIKPSGTGQGDGIEFFLGGEDERRIRDRIARSLATVRQRYGAAAGFPYTVAEYLDADVIDAPQHELHGRKFELRIVVYRHGSTLRALPSIAKVAPEAWDPAHPTRAALINNVSASLRRTGGSGGAHLLPLCSPSALALIGLCEAELAELCSWSTAYVAHILAELRSAPTSGKRC